MCRVSTSAQTRHFLPLSFLFNYMSNHSLCRLAFLIHLGVGTHNARRFLASSLSRLNPAQTRRNKFWIVSNFTKTGTSVCVCVCVCVHVWWFIHMSLSNLFSYNHMHTAFLQEHDAVLPRNTYGALDTFSQMVHLQLAAEIKPSMLT